MRDYLKAGPRFWTDIDGRVWQVSIGGKLHFGYPSHKAVRRFVFMRDRFTCQRCGARALEVPAEWNGTNPVWTDRKYDNRFARQYPAYAGFVPLVVDHIVSRRNGGSHHPSNLQALCDCCNSAKASLVDAKAGRASGLESRHESNPRLLCTPSGSQRGAE